VPIHTFLRTVKTEQEEEGGVFDPEQVEVMATAFEKVIADLNLKDRDDPIVTMVAKLVIELVRNGERDPEQIRKEILDKHRAA
jgi:hypothetical protein